MAKSANMLISSPIQAISQEEADIAIKEPIISTIKKNSFHGRISIKRRISP
jgi:hypothetical protein